ncbi:MAG: hypothetical protein Q4P71_08520 [Actinomycetaceae bacterium]|nr:hypothetical protein [Actinomycetaceae bacterium]
MPLFEFDDGRLIPAQFGRSVSDGLSADMLASIREQVLEIVGRPLFPITWQDAAPLGSGMDGGAPRLTALDASGQVVSVEVLEALTPATMIDSLSRLADTAALGWNDLAAAYPNGIHGFRIGWAEFRDAMPPSPAPGPRLILVVGSIDDQVRPALDVLASSGVEVHEISVRVMSNGRKFLAVEAVGPRMYGHNPSLLLGNTPRIPELTSAGVSEPSSGRHTEEPSAFEPSDDARVTETEAPSDASRQTQTDDFSEEVAADTPIEREPQPEPEPAEQEVISEADETGTDEPDTPDIEKDVDDEGIPLLKPSPDALFVIAQILQVDTPLVWQLTEHEIFQTTLRAVGEITTENWSTGDPTEAAAMLVGSSQYDGWDVWHISDLHGPTLREALEEINREIREEYETAGEPRRGRRTRGRRA